MRVFRRCGHYACLKHKRNRFDSDRAHMSRGRRLRMRNAKEKREYLVLRDGEDCWICGRRLDFDADPNDNMYPSIDHVKARCRGGSDSYDNLRLAHRICNSTKDGHVPYEENIRLQAEVRQRAKKAFANAEVRWK